MASLRELKTEEELENWGIKDAVRQTEMRQHMSKAGGRFEFITKGNKREAIPSTCNLYEYALSKYVMQLVSRPNTATYLLENVNYKSASEDFRKLICFIDTYPEPGKSELAALVFPVFVYFYLLLLQSGPSGDHDAKYFYKKNKDVFADEESYDAVLNALYSFNNWKDVKEDSYFKNFLECKYIVGLSPEVLCALRDFIESQAKEEGDKALLYVLHFHIHFQDSDEVEYIDSVNEKSLIPILEGNGHKSVKHDDAKSVTEPISVELYTSVTKHTENEKTKCDAVSNPDHASTQLTLSKSNSDNERNKFDDGRPESELDTLLKELNLNHPKISTVVTKCVGANICSVDFNEGETEIAYAVGNDHIYVAPLGIEEEETETEDSEDEPAKRLRTGEQKMHTSSFVPVSQGKSVKRVKTPRNGKTSKQPRGSKRIKEIKLNKDESTPQVSGMKKIKLPYAETVNIIKYLPGKPCLLLAACSTKVRLLNTQTGSFVAEYDRNNGCILDIDVNSTSQYFATANIDSLSCLYSFNVSTEIQTFVGHLSAVTSVRFHPNGIYIATGSEDCTVQMFDIESGLCIRKFSDYKYSISTIAFSPDGKLLSAADTFGAVKVWNIKDGSGISTVFFGKEFETLGKITTLCFHSGSSLIMACNLKGECKLWDIRNPKDIEVLNSVNTPLKAKFCKNGVWKMAFQESSFSYKKITNMEK